MNNGSKPVIAVERLATVDSTNAYLKRKIEQDVSKAPFAVMAESQTNGHGRNGRKWLNTFGALLMSVALPLYCLQPNEYSLVTLAAAVSVNSCFKRLGIETKIKWPNDIWLEGKKLCGILTSLVNGADSKKYAVVGIGANVNADDFPTDLLYETTSVKKALGRSTDTYTLCIDICTELVGRMDDIISSSERRACVFSEYRRDSIIIGSEIIVNTVDGDSFEAFADDVDLNGELIVTKKTGAKIRISAADVSIKKLMGNENGAGCFKRNESGN